MTANGRRARANGDAPQTDFLRLLESNAALTQSYEALMSSLRLLNGTRPLRTVLFTSAQPEEGKTTVAVGLAVAMARAGKRVLIIDADLRRPKIHRLLGLDNVSGLADIIAGRRRGGDVVQAMAIAGGADSTKCTLTALTSGASAAGAFMAMQSPSLAESIREFGGAYEAVLIDSPPVLSVSDPLLLAPLVDGVVLVVNTGVVTEADAKRAKQRLEQAGARIVGVVMNRFDEQVHGPGFHPYHGYYATGTKA